VVASTEPVVNLAEPVVDAAASLADEPLPAPVVVEPIEFDFDAGELPAASFDDNVKVIGPLRVALPLFNIFVLEADDQSRRLQVALQGWAHDVHGPVGEEAEALAHALAGNSATVGHAELSAMARSLEHAIKRSNERDHGHAQEAALLVNASDDIRRVLSQFFAGFLASPSPSIVEQLLAHEAMTFDRPGVVAPPALAQDVDVAVTAAPPVAAMPIAVPVFVKPVAAPVAASVPQEDAKLKRRATPAKTTVTRPAALAMEDDDLDATDAVDDELFAIFEEEGLDLFPKLSTHMRDWVEAPTNAAASNACLRSLHTIKGGARLAGAMRLGEMAHRLESSIEQLVARGDASALEVEALQLRVDALGSAFDRLRLTVQGSRDPQWETASSEDDFASESDLTSIPTLSTLTAAAPAPSVSPQPVAPAAASTSAPSKIELLGTSTSRAASTPAPSAGRVVARLGGSAIDWSRFSASSTKAGGERLAVAPTAAASGAVRVKAALLDRLVNQSGEVSITRSRIDADVAQLKGAIIDLTDNLDRMRNQLREIELQAESQISSRLEAVKVEGLAFDPLEMDRFTRFQELTRMLAESVNDVATVHRGLQRTVQSTEDQLVAQARLTRDLQENLLRTRMVEFDSLSDRLYRVVRQAGKETGKQVRLDIVNGTIEVDRGVLERMGGSFEHLLRNCVSHGVELPDARVAAGKDSAGTITVTLHQEGNEVTIEVGDDGAGLNYDRIRERAVSMKLIDENVDARDSALAPLIFAPGFTTATHVTELAGRGVGMDVVRNEVNALGGRVETTSRRGLGTTFKLVLPLTTAVTQVTMVRAGGMTVAIPTTLVESVQRTSAKLIDGCLQSGEFVHEGHHSPFYWFGSLLQESLRSGDAQTEDLPVVMVRSAQQRVAIHVDEVLGNQEVVVKNLGPQLSRLPGLAGITILASGSVVLIYNPVALANLYGSAVRELMVTHQQSAHASTQVAAQDRAVAGTAALGASDLGTGLLRQLRTEEVAPLVLVVDDSLTVRRVTQRLLQREGFRVVLAKDGLDGLDKLAQEVPAVVLSDIEMPRMDGFDMVKNLREDQRFSSLPVIMITSRIAQKHKDHAATLGVNHYLGKPYGEEELLQLIRQYTQAKETARSVN
jgi:chemosensory pili system protein ChpA (sensor histidine kinase/response regulator)